MPSPPPPRSPKDDLVAGGPRGLRTTALVAAIGLTAAGPLACRRGRPLPRPDGAAVVVAADSTAEAGLVLADEVEPNDVLANAQPLAPTVETGAGVAGHLIAPPGAKAKDLDLFKVVVPSPAVVTGDADGGAPPPRQRLSIDVRPETGMAISVDALDDQGRLLVTAVGMSPGESEGIPNLAVTPGTYFIRVKPGSAVPAAGSSPSSPRRDAGTPNTGGSLAYRVAVRLLPFEPGDEVEPNGKGALANDVTAGGDVAGFLAWRHDEDWFRLPLAGLPEGSVLSADLDAPAGVAVSLTIADSVEHRMTEQKGRKGDRVAIRNVRLPSSEPHLYVVVKTDSGRNLGDRYVLRLRVEEAKADAEMEPNDDPTHAVPIGDGTFVGTMGPGDVDVYRYSSPMPAELNFEATPPERVDLKVELLREDGTPIAKIDAGKRREPERLPNVFVEGAVLLRLSAGKGDGNLDEPYRIVASSHPIEPGAEREPNGTPALATQLSAGASGTGLLYPRGDIDVWAVQPPAEAFGVSVHGIAGLTLDVRVQSLGGKELSRFKVGGDASAPTRVSAGTERCCLVQIREATGRGANARDHYGVQVTP
jgi:hypothetical protein